MAVATEVHVLQELATDESLQPLLGDQFDPKSFATHTIQCQIVGEMLQKLTQGISELDSELYSQVVTHYEDLLSQATGIEALETVLKMMRTRIDSLTTAVDSTKIIDPYQKIVSRTDQLTRLQSACDLLRKVIRMLYLMKRLRTQVQGGVKEITKVAQTFNEIDQLMQGEDLKGIEVLDRERPWLQHAHKEAESQAKKMLLQGLEHLNPTHVGVALQVFYNLGQLENILVTVLDSYLEAVQHEVQNAVDPTSLLHSFNAASGSGMSTRMGLPGGSGSVTWKANLWTQLEKLSDALWKLYRQAYQLEIVLGKKRDPVTQVSFLASLEGTVALKKLNNFWNSIANVIGVELNTAAKASLPLNQTFENDYPKLFQVFSGLLSQVEKLYQLADHQSKSIPSFLSPQSTPEAQTANQRQQSLLKALSQFEKIYVSRLFSRLSEAVNQLFGIPTHTLPKDDELVTVVRLLASELQTAGQCTPLSLILAGSVSRIIRMFNAKCEQLVVTGYDATQVSGPPSSSQQRNTAIVNILHQFQTLCQEFIFNSVTLDESAVNPLQSALKQTNDQKVAVLRPFVNEVCSVMEKMVASMHSENFTVQAHTVQSERRDSTDVPSSGFVRELLSFTARIYQEHFSPLKCQDVVRDMLRGVTGRVLEIYVRHVCMIRPLSEGGKMRVTSDMAQIELALIPFCSKLSEVGEPHKMIRSLRRLLFLAPDNFLSQPAGVGDIIPISYILNFLFSRAPTDMKSPYQLQNWTQDEYSNWMDKHPSETDRLAFVKATLDSYTKKTKGKEPPAICVVMEKLVKQALSE